jgi:hypothetical protein
MLGSALPIEIDDKYVLQHHRCDKTDLQPVQQHHKCEYDTQLILTPKCVMLDTCTCARHRNILLKQSMIKCVYQFPEDVNQHLRNWFTIGKLPAFDECCFIQIRHLKLPHIYLLISHTEKYRQCLYPICLNIHTRQFYSTAQPLYYMTSQTLSIKSIDGRKKLIVLNGSAPAESKRDPITVAVVDLEELFTL